METSALTKPGLAFVGVGWIGKNRMEAAARTGLADIIGVSDPDAQCMEDAANAVRARQKYKSFEDTLQDPDVDAVVIATPSALHMEQAILAFNHGKAVFCQKPLGRSASEVKAVISAAKHADRLLGADFSYRFTNAFRAVHETVASGELGQIFAAELRFHNAYGPGKPWFYDVLQSGGGCVLDLGVHMIDLLLYTFEFPGVSHVKGSLFAKGYPLKERNDVEDYADVVIDLDNGVHAHLACSWNLQAGTEAIIEASFYGTRGGVSFRNVNGSFYDFAAYRHRGTSTDTMVSPPDAWGGKAITHWLQQLSAGARYEADATNYLASANVIDRIYGIE